MKSTFKKTLAIAFVLLISGQSWAAQGNGKTAEQVRARRTSEARRAQAQAQNNAKSVQPKKNSNKAKADEAKKKQQELANKEAAQLQQAIAASKADKAKADEAKKKQQELANKEAAQLQKVLEASAAQHRADEAKRKKEEARLRQIAEQARQQQAQQVALQARQVAALQAQQELEKVLAESQSEAERAAALQAQEQAQLQQAMRNSQVDQAQREQILREQAAIQAQNAQDEAKRGNEEVRLRQVAEQTRALQAQQEQARQAVALQAQQEREHQAQLEAMRNSQIKQAQREQVLREREVIQAQNAQVVQEMQLQQQRLASELQRLEAERLAEVNDADDSEDDVVGQPIVPADAVAINVAVQPATPAEFVAAMRHMNATDAEFKGGLQEYVEEVEEFMLKTGNTKPEIDIALAALRQEVAAAKQLADEQDAGYSMTAKIIGTATGVGAVIAVIKAYRSGNLAMAATAIASLVQSGKVRVPEITKALGKSVKQGILNVQQAESMRLALGGLGIAVTTYVATKVVPVAKKAAKQVYDNKGTAAVVGAGTYALGSYFDVKQKGLLAAGAAALSTVDVASAKETAVKAVSAVGGWLGGFLSSSSATPTVTVVPAVVTTAPVVAAPAVLTTIAVVK